MQQQVVIQQGAPAAAPVALSDGRYPGYQSQSSTTLGALQVTVGILSILFNIAGRVLEAANSVVSHGIWCGIFFIITGSYGIVAARQKTKCPIVAFMVLSIFSAIMCIFLLSFSAAGIEDDNDRFCYYGFCFTYSGLDDSTRAARLAMNGLLVALALFEVVIAIWSSAICCSSVCCGNNTHSSQGVMQTVHYVNQPGQPQVMVISGGQPMGQFWAQPMPHPSYTMQQAGTAVHMPQMQQPPAYSPQIYNQPPAGSAPGGVAPSGAAGYNPPVYNQPTGGDASGGAVGYNPQAPPLPPKKDAW